MRLFRLFKNDYADFHQKDWRISLWLKKQITQIFKKDFIIGLDIGSSSIKIAQFTKKEDGPHLVKADLREIKETKDSLLYEQEAVSTIKDLFRGIDIKKSKIILAINCPKTAIKIAKAPYMPEAELRDGINLEAKNYFPFPIDDSLLDYEILGDVVEKGIRKYEVAVSVSPKSTVEKYLSLLEKAGIRPASFVPYAYAMQKSAEYLSGEKDAITCAIVIGKVHTELVIFKSGAMIFGRKIPVSGDDFTKAMTGVLVSDRGKTELSIDEAEKIKKEVGIPFEAEAKIIDDKISTTQILAMLRAPLEQLVSEIGRCFDYYREESGGTKIGSLVLFGGGAALGGLVKYLSEGLSIEVRLGDVLEGLKIEPDAIRQKGNISYRLGTAIGAALTEAKGINLLPPEIKEETKRVVKRGTVEAIASAAVLILMLVYIGMRIQLGNLEKRISVAKMELASLAGQYKNAEAYHLADMVLVGEPHWEDIFKELSNVIPDEIHITDFKMEDGVITVEGIAVCDNNEEVISKFIFNLENGIFKNVKLVKTVDLKESPGGKFVIRCCAE